MTRDDLLNNIADCIADAKSVLMVVHESPDGDAIGSMLAMGAVLKLLRKEIVMYSVDVVPKKLRFLTGWQNVTNDETMLNREFDVMIMLDCGDRYRAGDFITAYKRYKKLINIDHHASNDKFGDHNFIEINSSSTGEHIYFVIKTLLGRMGSEKIPDEISTSILTAIYDDTGGMRYISTTSRTLRIAAELVDSGANCSYISEHLFFSVSREKMQLTSRVLSTLTFDENYKIAYLTMRAKDLEDTGAFTEDSEGLIDFPRAIYGVEVAFMIKETGRDKYKMSFRSRGLVDLNEFCTQFGGGGHKVAAGCTISAPYEEAKNRILEGLKTVLNKKGI
jgi:bifunctional oligoribonuclease and PAP phosphatase NrnA